jgi:hypothetical protein
MVHIKINALLALWHPISRRRLQRVVFAQSRRCRHRPNRPSYARDRSDPRPQLGADCSRTVLHTQPRRMAPHARTRTRSLRPENDIRLQLMKLLLAESIDALDRIKRTAAKYLASQRSAVSHIWFSSCVLASSGFGGGAVTTGAGGGGAAQAASPATAQAARMRRLLDIGEVALFPKGRAGHMRISVLDSPNSAIRSILVRPMQYRPAKSVALNVRCASAARQQQRMPLAPPSP